MSDTQQFDLAEWIASRDAWVTANLGERLDDGDILCACNLQRFFIRSGEEADEAGRRAMLDPLLALELVESELMHACERDWTIEAWWALDFDAAYEERLEFARCREAHRHAMSHCPDVIASLGGVGLVLQGWRVDTETVLPCCGLHPLRAPDFHTVRCVQCDVDALRADYVRLQPGRAAELEGHPARYAFTRQ